MNAAEKSQTIMQQLGGNRFVAMTGARNFSYTGTDPRANLTFHLPSARNVCKAKYVRIVLEANDTYTVEFLNNKAVVVRTDAFVYANSLQIVFTNATGLDTHL